MSFANLNGFDVVDLHVSLPRHGVWHADVVVDEASGAPSSGAVTLSVGKSFTLKGTIVRGGEWRGRRSLRIVGGAGKLQADVTGRWYQGAPFRLAVSDTLEEVGERLSTTSTAAVLDAVATPGWMRTGGPAADALARLALDAGATWRVLPDGTVFVGTETWPLATADDDAVTLGDAQRAGRVHYVTESPALLPGQSLAGRNVSYVELTVTEARIRVDAWLEVDAAPTTDRVKRGLRALVDATVGPRLDYLAMYPAKVVHQGSDGRLELLADDARIGSIGPLPIRYGIPGVTVKVRAGTRVAVGFDGGDPRSPYAALFGDSDVEEIKIAADKIKVGGGGLNAARQGDLVMIGGGPPPHGVIVFADGGPIVTGKPYLVGIYGLPGPPLPLCAPISTGNPSVLE